MNSLVVGTLGQMIEDMENGVYNLTDNGKCTGCGACCSNFLPMTDKEVSTIRQYIKKHNIKAQKHFFPTTKATEDFTCPFLNTNKPKDKCTIYPVRPLVCRKFICDSNLRDNLAGEKAIKNMNVVMVRQEFFGG